MRTIIILLILAVNISAQWVQQVSGTSKILRAISTRGLSNTNEAWVVGLQGAILHTTNGGTNWINTFSPTNEHLYDVHFVNQSTGIAVGSNGVYIRTTNAGGSWSVNFAGLDMYSLHFINATTGFMSGESGAIFKTTDAGLNWNGIGVSGLDNNGIYFLSGTTGFTCGPVPNLSTSSIKKTTNNGSNWIEGFNGNGILNNIMFYDDQKGWACGNSGRVVITTNSGSTWTSSFPVGSNIRLNDIYFSEPEEFGNGTTGWIAADSGKIFTSTNSGVNWSAQSTPTTEYLYAVRVIANTTGWAVGSNGTILKTTNGGVTIGIQQISNEVPKDFSLSQNYPNPFNPVTNIKFSITLSSFVNLTVYDASGREVETLVNGSLKAGTYNADWNAGKYTSGVYFYRITTGDFISTKKMILVK
jgi:photosystem II stability/assembly factor-like uncharacterized protein